MLKLRKGVLWESCAHATCTDLLSHMQDLFKLSVILSFVAEGFL